VEKVVALALVAMERLEAQMMGIMEVTEVIVARTGIVLPILKILLAMVVVVILVTTLLVQERFKVHQY
jgi:hypothetical protein